MSMDEVMIRLCEMMNEQQSLMLLIILDLITPDQLQGLIDDLKSKLTDLKASYNSMSSSQKNAPSVNNSNISVGDEMETQIQNLETLIDKLETLMEKAEQAGSAGELADVMGEAEEVIGEATTKSFDFDMPDIIESLVGEDLDINQTTYDEGTEDILNEFDASQQPYTEDENGYLIPNEEAFDDAKEVLGKANLFVTMAILIQNYIDINWDSRVMFFNEALQKPDVEILEIASKYQQRWTKMVMEKLSDDLQYIMETNAGHYQEEMEAAAEEAEEDAEEAIEDDKFLEDVGEVFTGENEKGQEEVLYKEYIAEATTEYAAALQQIMDVFASIMVGLTGQSFSTDPQMQTMYEDLMTEMSDPDNWLESLGTYEWNEENVSGNFLGVDSEAQDRFMGQLGNLFLVRELVEQVKGQMRDLVSQLIRFFFDLPQYRSSLSARLGLMQAQKSLVMTGVSFYSSSIQSYADSYNQAIMLEKDAIEARDNYEDKKVWDAIANILTFPIYAGFRIAELMFNYIGKALEAIGAPQWMVDAAKFVEIINNFAYDADSGDIADMVELFGGDEEDIPGWISTVADVLGFFQNIVRSIGDAVVNAANVYTWQAQQNYDPQPEVLLAEWDKDYEDIEAVDAEERKDEVAESDELEASIESEIDDLDSAKYITQEGEWAVIDENITDAILKIQSLITLLQLIAAMKAMMLDTRSTVLQMTLGIPSSGSKASFAVGVASARAQLMMSKVQRVISNLQENIMYLNNKKADKVERDQALKQLIYSVISVITAILSIICLIIPGTQAIGVALMIVTVAVAAYQFYDALRYEDMVDDYELTTAEDDMGLEDQVKEKDRKKTKEAYETSEATRVSESMDDLWREMLMAIISLTFTNSTTDTGSGYVAFDASKLAKVSKKLAGAYMGMLMLQTMQDKMLETRRAVYALMFDIPLSQNQMAGVMGQVLKGQFSSAMTLLNLRVQQINTDVKDSNRHNQAKQAVIVAAVNLGVSIVGALAQGFGSAAMQAIAAVTPLLGTLITYWNQIQSQDLDQSIDTAVQNFETMIEDEKDAFTKALLQTVLDFMKSSMTPTSNGNVGLNYSSQNTMEYKMENLLRTQTTILEAKREYENAIRQVISKMLGVQMPMSSLDSVIAAVQAVGQVIQSLSGQVVNQQQQFIQRTNEITQARQQFAVQMITNGIQAVAGVSTQVMDNEQLAQTINMVVKYAVPLLEMMLTEIANEIAENSVNKNEKYQQSNTSSAPASSASDLEVMAYQSGADAADAQHSRDIYESEQAYDNQFQAMIAQTVQSMVTNFIKDMIQGNFSTFSKNVIETLNNQMIDGEASTDKALDALDDSVKDPKNSKSDKTDADPSMDPTAAAAVEIAQQAAQRAQTAADATLSQLSQEQDSNTQSQKITSTNASQAEESRAETAAFHDSDGEPAVATVSAEAKSTTARTAVAVDSDVAAPVTAHDGVEILNDMINPPVVKPQNPPASAQLSAPQKADAMAQALSKMAQSKPAEMQVLFGEIYEHDPSLAAAVVAQMPPEARQVLQSVLVNQMSDKTTANARSAAQLSVVSEVKNLAESAKLDPAELATELLNTELLNSDSTKIPAQNVLKALKQAQTAQSKAMQTGGKEPVKEAVQAQLNATKTAIAALDAHSSQPKHFNFGSIFTGTQRARLDQSSKDITKIQDALYDAQDPAEISALSKELQKEIKTLKHIAAQQLKSDTPAVRQSALILTQALNHIEVATVLSQASAEVVAQKASGTPAEDIRIKTPVVQQLTELAAEAPDPVAQALHEALANPELAKTLVASAASKGDKKDLLRLLTQTETLVEWASAKPDTAEGTPAKQNTVDITPLMSAFSMMDDVSLYKAAAQLLYAAAESPEAAEALKPCLMQLAEQKLFRKAAQIWSETFSDKAENLSRQLPEVMSQVSASTHDTPTDKGLPSAALHATDENPMMVLSQVADSLPASDVTSMIKTLTETPASDLQILTQVAEQVAPQTRVNPSIVSVATPVDVKTVTPEQILQVAQQTVAQQDNPEQMLNFLEKVTENDPALMVAIAAQVQSQSPEAFKVLQTEAAVRMEAAPQSTKAATTYGLVSEVQRVMESQNISAAEIATDMLDGKTETKMNSDVLKAVKVSKAAQTQTTEVPLETSDSAQPSITAHSESVKQVVTALVTTCKAVEQLKIKSPELAEELSAIQSEIDSPKPLSPEASQALSKRIETVSKGLTELVKPHLESSDPAVKRDAALVQQALGHVQTAAVISQMVAPILAQKAANPALDLADLRMEPESLTQLAELAEQSPTQVTQAVKDILKNPQLASVVIQSCESKSAKKDLLRVLVQTETVAEAISEQPEAMAKVLEALPEMRPAEQRAVARAVIQARAQATTPEKQAQLEVCVRALPRELSQAQSTAPNTPIDELETMVQAYRPDQALPDTETPVVRPQITQINLSPAVINSKTVTPEQIIQVAQQTVAQRDNPEQMLNFLEQVTENDPALMVAIAAHVQSQSPEAFKVLQTEAAVRMEAAPQSTKAATTYGLVSEVQRVMESQNISAADIATEMLDGKTETKMNSDVLKAVKVSKAAQTQTTEVPLETSDSVQPSIAAHSESVKQVVTALVTTCKAVKQLKIQSSALAEIDKELSAIKSEIDSPKPLSPEASQVLSKRIETVSKGLTELVKPQLESSDPAVKRDAALVQQALGHVQTAAVLLQMVAPILAQKAANPALDLADLRMEPESLTQLAELAEQSPTQVTQAVKDILKNPQLAAVVIQSCEKPTAKKDLLRVLVQTESVTEAILEQPEAMARVLAALPEMRPAEQRVVARAVVQARARETNPEKRAQIEVCVRALPRELQATPSAPDNIETELETLVQSAQNPQAQTTSESVVVPISSAMPEAPNAKTALLLSLISELAPLSKMGLSSQEMTRQLEQNPKVQLLKSLEELGRAQAGKPSLGPVRKQALAVCEAMNAVARTPAQKQAVQALHSGLQQAKTLEELNGLLYDPSTGTSAFEQSLDAVTADDPSLQKAAKPILQATVRMLLLKQQLAANPQSEASRDAFNDFVSASEALPTETLELFLNEHDGQLKQMFEGLKKSSPRQLVLLRALAGLSQNSSQTWFTQLMRQDNALMQNLLLAFGNKELAEPQRKKLTQRVEPLLLAAAESQKDSDREAGMQMLAKLWDALPPEEKETLLENLQERWERGKPELWSKALTVIPELGLSDKQRQADAADASRQGSMGRSQTLVQAAQDLKSAYQSEKPEDFMAAWQRVAGTEGSYGMLKETLTEIDHA